jgi:hypothetical protein
VGSLEFLPSAAAAAAAVAAAAVTAVDDKDVGVLIF